MVKSYRLIASIIRSRGLKGEVQVQSSADLPFYLRPQAELWVVPPPAPSSAPRLTQILSLRGPEQRPWLFLAGVNDRTTATALIGRQLLAASADCQSTSDDQ
ncbi:MAG: hypothetical protein FWC59_02735, partial [Actinomycetia bacterium]|nr:hypothetical protein [Actinomycetes bacterium]